MRDAPQGTRFSYASAETEILAAVLQGATGMHVSDYLGPLPANDGVRPRRPRAPAGHRARLPAGSDRLATRAGAVPARPGQATPYYGYGYQFWTFPGERRRFALLGVYGQMIFVDPQLKLVMVQTAANATAKAGGTTLGREADAFWRALVQHYGRW